VGGLAQRPKYAPKLPRRSESNQVMVPFGVVCKTVGLADPSSSCEHVYCRVKPFSGQGGACGAAGPASAPRLGLGGARPAHAGPHTGRLQVRTAHTATPPGARIGRRSRLRLSRWRPPRQDRLRRRCAITARSASLNLDPAPAHKGLAPARTTDQTSTADVPALRRESMPGTAEVTMGKRIGAVTVCETFGPGM